MFKSTAGRPLRKMPCYRRVAVLPIRYAVVPRGLDDPAYRYGAAGLNLEQGFPALKLSRYTLRALRPGFVYVFTHGPAGESLAAFEYSGEGLFQPLHYPTLEDYSRGSALTRERPDPCVWVKDCEYTARDAWLGYSPHLWTRAMAARITGSAALRERHLRRIDIAELLNRNPEPSQQPHVLPHSALRSWVEDFKPADRRMNLHWSSHCSKHGGLEAAIAQSAAQGYPQHQPRIPAVVALNDPEGLALDLGLSVSAYHHRLRDLMAPPAAAQPGDTREQVPPWFEHDIEWLRPASREYHHQNISALLLEQTLVGMYPGGHEQLERDVRAAHRPGAEPQSEARQRYRILTNPDLSKDGARLGERILQSLYFDFLKQREVVEDQLWQLRSLALWASADHDAWLATAEPEQLETPYGLAAAHATYDRDHFHSAQGLEISLALAIHAMSQVQPGTDEECARYQRLSRWADNQRSPLYTAVAPFNPFNDKADAMATAFLGVDAIIELKFPRFPAVESITDLITEAVHTVLLKRLSGEARWNKAALLRHRVARAAEEGKMAKLIGLLMGRYQLTDEKLGQAPLSKALKAFTDTGMAQIVEHAGAVHPSGTRTVRLEQTTTSKVTPSLAGLVRTAGFSGGINALALWFNITSLQVAFNALQKQASTETATAFGSALFGMIGTLSGALVTARSVQVAAVMKLGSTAPIALVGGGVVRYLGSPVYARLVGYPAIVLSAASDAFKVSRQIRNGDSVSAALTAVAAINITAGSVMVLKAGLNISRALSVGGVIGKVTAAITIIGTVLLASGAAVSSMANSRLHRSVELWAARGQFGNLLNDGEERGADFDRNERLLRRYQDSDEEMTEWYAACFSPVILDSEKAADYGLHGTNPRLQDSTHWGVYDWGDGAFYNPAGKETEVDFAVLLPGYILGQSVWSANITMLDVETKFTQGILIEPNCYLVRAGLILRYKLMVRGRKKLRFDFRLCPNQGFDESIIVNRRIEL